MQPPPARSPVLAQLAVLTAVAVGFLSGIDNFFAGDDFDWLFTTVRTVMRPLDFFGEQSNFVRHGESLYFIVNYLVAGFSYPAFFASSLLIHLLNVFLVGRLLLRVGCSETPALLAALLWGLNYRHSEVVFRPYGIADSLVLACCLGALLLFIGRRPALAALCLVGGLFSKENAIVFPLLAVLWALQLEERGDRLRRLAATVPQWLAVGLFLPLLVVLREGQSSYLDIGWAAVPRFWGILLSLVGPDAVYLEQARIGTGAPLLPFWLALALLPVAAVICWQLPASYRFAVQWIVVTTLPTLFVPFQVSRYYYVPLVGVALLVGLLGSDLVAHARRTGGRVAIGAAAAVYALYLAHAAWGVQIEESDYQVIGDLHRQAARSFGSDVVDELPGPNGPLTLFVRGDTTTLAEALERRYTARPWYWPTTYKWIYRRPHGVLGLTNTFGFVTYCADGRRRPSLFVAATRDEYQRAIVNGQVVVVAHDTASNRFRIAPEELRREVLREAAASDLYSYLQAGRFDPIATGRQRLGG